ncbi:endonuclease/exonuclease/phosphatase family protein [Salix suchowensis]|nr:endonuclease/exonuclease/phosphatase family protein [Salix suchowensis]
MVETKLPVHEHVAPLEIQVPHVDVESSKQGEAQGVHEMIATTVGTLTKNLKEQEQELGKKTGHKLDKGKLPQGDESRMDTMSSSADGNEAQFAIQTWINQNKVDVFGILESRIRANNMATVLPKILPCNWEAMTNIGEHPNGWIVVGWDANKLQLRFVDSSAQWLTLILWNYINRSSEENTNIPWAIMGDFNAILRPSDRSGGANDWQSHHEDFQDCITRSSLQQIPYNGIRLSWHNGQTGRNTIMRKLDWVFGNLTLLTRWPAVRATFLPRHNSDHSAMVLGMEALKPREKSSFKFMNQWADHGDFQGIVQGVWGQRIVGNRMFQLTSKLAILKQHLRVKHWRSMSHLSLKVFQAKV